MILLDFSQVFIGSFMQVAKHEPPDEDMVRHVALNTIRFYNKKYKEEYGDMVVCCDHYHTWRKEFFPPYKATRKLKREKDEKDYISGKVTYTWDELFKSLNKVRDEIRESLPYTVMHVEQCEADDVIATLCKYFQTEETIPTGNGNLFEEKQKILIISSDKDFIQLQHFGNVNQFSPLAKKNLIHKDPVDFLEEHIISGDRSDGVPNVLSSDDCFVQGLRQSPLTKKRLSIIKEGNLSEKERIGYSRNKTLIDLSQIPEKIETSIINQWKTTDQCKDRKHILNYFIKFRLKNLMDVIEDF